MLLPGRFSLHDLPTDPLTLWHHAYQALSGAARATIDACRTLLIWLFSLAVGWEDFHQLQGECGSCCRTLCWWHNQQLLPLMLLLRPHQLQGVSFLGPVHETGVALVG